MVVGLTTPYLENLYARPLKYLCAALTPFYACARTAFFKSVRLVLPPPTQRTFRNLVKMPRNMDDPLAIYAVHFVFEMRQGSGVRTNQHVFREVHL